MTDLRKAAEMALDTLTKSQPLIHSVENIQTLMETIRILRQELAQFEHKWISLTDRDITNAAHNEAKYPVSILETTDSGLCMQFSETGEWHSSDKKGDFMKINNFLMSFAKAIETTLKEKNT